MIKLPSEVVTFAEGSSPTAEEKREVKKLVFETGDGEFANVLLWHRWPSYDFIFGVPMRKSKTWKYERGFFMYRDVRGKKVKAGFWVDFRELRILADGFKRLLQHARRRESCQRS